MNTRQRWIALALIVTVAAAFWPGHEDSDEVVERVSREPRSARAPASATAGNGGPAQQAAPVARERLAAMQGNLFPRQTWVPPPPPPKPFVPPPPPAPKPPPLPFQYLGRWVDDGGLTVFLMHGEQLIPIKPGQVLSGNWRVDEITERTVLFTYLPLDMQSTLGITQ